MPRIFCPLLCDATRLTDTACPTVPLRGLPQSSPLGMTGKRETELSCRRHPLSGCAAVFLWSVAAVGARNPGRNHEHDASNQKCKAGDYANHIARVPRSPKEEQSRDCEQNPASKIEHPDHARGHGLTHQIMHRSWRLAPIPTPQPMLQVLTRSKHGGSYTRARDVKLRAPQTEQTG